MLFLLRQIRRRLIKKNKITTYLLYAIGEIFLVVIGILIAVRINNLNNQLKSDQHVKSLFQSLEKELEQNIQTANGFIAHGYRIDQSLKRYISADDPEDFDHVSSRLLIFAPYSQNFLDDNLVEIINYENKLPDAYQHHILDMKELKRRIDSRRSWEKKEMELSNARQKEMVDNFEWFYSDDSLSAVEAYAYLSSTIHKNKVRHFFNIRLQENVFDASLIRTLSVALLWKVKNLNGHGEMSFRGFLDDLALQPIPSIPCFDAKTDKIRNSTSFRRNFIIYNDMNVDVTLTEREDGDSTYAVKLPAKSFFTEEYYLAKNGYLEVPVKEGCNAAFYHSQGDYLVLDGSE